MVAPRPAIGGEGPRRLLAPGACLEPTNELLEGDVQCATDFPKVKQVEAAFAQLVLAHKRLVPMQPLGQVRLTHPSLQAELPQQVEQRFTVPRGTASVASLSHLEADRIDAFGVAQGGLWFGKLPPRRREDTCDT